MPRDLYALEVTPGARMLLALLWTYASPEDPHAFPSQATLAAVSGQSARSVRRQLVQLTEAGVIEKGRRGERWVWVLHRTPRSGGRVGPNRTPRSSGQDGPTGHLGPSNRTPRSGGRMGPDRTPRSAEPDTSVRPNRTPRSYEQPGNNQNNHGGGGDAPPSPPRNLGLLTAEQVEHRPSPKAKIRELWAWFEGELVRRKLRRKPKGLPDDQLRAIQRLLTHIRQALGCDLDEALASQRAHLEWRLAEGERDDGTRRYLRTPTAWRSGWWDWFHDQVEDAPREPRAPIEYRGEVPL